jgi:hypothetical protein
MERYKKHFKENSYEYDQLDVVLNTKGGLVKVKGHNYETKWMRLSGTFLASLEQIMTKYGIK